MIVEQNCKNEVVKKIVNLLKNVIRIQYVLVEVALSFSFNISRCSNLLIMAFANLRVQWIFL